MAIRQFLEFRATVTVPKIVDDAVADAEMTLAVNNAFAEFKKAIGEQFPKAEIDTAHKTIKRKDA